MEKTDALIGESDHFLSVLDHVSRVAPLNRPVLVIGERGTGKELIAQRVHYLSRRWDAPLVSLNCAALSDGLIDSELFGHEAGSFSGAKGKHSGRFERAENGTLFLDELGTTPLGVQEKLLRVIEYGEYERVGGSKPLSADVRLVCATNENLPEMVEDGKFRADLLDRLAFDVIHLPPLRERREDILLLAENFAVKMCRELEYGYFAGFTREAKETLLDYRWPGNIRELKNVVERAVYRKDGENAPIDDLYLDPFTAPWHEQSSTDSDVKHGPHTMNRDISLPFDLRQWQNDIEKDVVIKALDEAKFNQRRAAELLGLSYHQIRGLLKKHSLASDEKSE
ncbi:phage shock protein operon transcriptional activator [Veronia nyctiphanis]|uniref:Phage shock protein operon transcriptional activator n=1 Tax=Veronia nyctiphanis TaxID=1278244 RepID=A0A4Q0YU55_9GAMM|nr:phage shock protein operon transcriptional activator [Veronia nyctiphanis]RXJ73664.1 phage shock protein operon transcriptional activator [Veronia nyctiphanis]